MNLIELHIIQSFPVSCLNRDDLGSPKSAVFGGVKRARISSQCLKRAQRDLFREYAPGYAKGMRTKLIASELLQCLKEESEPLPEPAEEIARRLAEIWGKLDDKKRAPMAFPSPRHLPTFLPKRQKPRSLLRSLCFGEQTLPSQLIWTKPSKLP